MNLIIVAGGVSYYGLSDLILLKGTMQELSNAQALEYYKDNFENFKKLNKNMFFEQDGASSHTSKKIKKLLEELFGDNLIQNAPHGIKYKSLLFKNFLKISLKDAKKS